MQDYQTFIIYGHLRGSSQNLLIYKCYLSHNRPTLLMSYVIWRINKISKSANFDENGAGEMKLGTLDSAISAEHIAIDIGFVEVSHSR